jgi:hypothetical protein
MDSAAASAPGSARPGRWAITTQPHDLPRSANLAPRSRSDTVALAPEGRLQLNLQIDADQAAPLQETLTPQTVWSGPYPNLHMVMDRRCAQAHEQSSCSSRAAGQSAICSANSPIGRVVQL